MKKVSYVFIGCGLIIFSFFIWIVISSKRDHYFSQQKTSKIKPLILGAHFAEDKIDSLVNLSEIFPYELYIKNENYKSIQIIKNDLILLDSLFPTDLSKNRKVLSSTLTSQLCKQFHSHFKTFQPDSLLKILQWAEKFYYYSEIDPSNDIFYQSIYQYWLDTISNTLHKFSYKTPSLKYDFKFEYIQTRLKEKGAIPDIKKTSFEKAVDNAIHTRWSHLLNASWNQTSLLQKILFFLILLITLYGYISIIKKHFIKR